MSVDSAYNAERLPLAAVVVNWNGGDRLVRCVGSLLTSKPPPAEILVVDNASSDGSTGLVHELEGVRLLENGANLGFAGGANAGAGATSAPLLLFVNPDVRFEAGALATLVAELLEDERIGIVGPEVRNTDGTLQNRGLVIDPTGHPTGATSDDVFFVSGCALAARRELFEQLGGFDTDYFMFVEDLDLCWRAQLLGRKVRVVPSAVVFHDGGASLPGGYLTNGVLRTNATRLYLRERNTLAAVLTNYGVARSLTMASTRVLMAAVEACVWAVRGRPTASGAYLRALAWVVRHAAPIAAKRRSVQRSRIVSDRELRGLVNRLVKLDVVRSAGLPVLEPTVVEESVEKAVHGFDVVGVHNSPGVRAARTARVSSLYARNYARRGTHELVLRLVPTDSRVLDVGCASGYLGAALIERGCRMWGVEQDPVAAREAAVLYEDVATLDLDGTSELPWPRGSFDVVLAADVLEHLRDPLGALQRLREYARPGAAFVISLPNVAHASVRLPLLFGRFRYRESGILDRTHCRLFTFSTAHELAEASGLELERMHAGSDPFGGALAVPVLGRALRGLLAYNIVLLAKEPPGA